MNRRTFLSFLGLSPGMSKIDVVKILEGQSPFELSTEGSVIHLGSNGRKWFEIHSKDIFRYNGFPKSYFYKGEYYGT